MNIFSYGWYCSAHWSVLEDVRDLVTSSNAFVVMDLSSRKSAGGQFYSCGLILLVVWWELGHLYENIGQTETCNWEISFDWTFMTTFLHTHTWVNWVDGDKVGLRTGFIIIGTADSVKVQVHYA